MKQTPTKPALISIIVTTYNNPAMLNLVLGALSKLQFSHFEILIADDGSTRETADAILNWQRELWMPVKHIWHEDQGFRAGAIRNRAVAAAQGDYLIFLDGDCLVQATFLKRHFALAEKGYFVAGNRVLCSQAFTQLLCAQDYREVDVNRFYDVWLKLTGKINRWLPLLSLPLKSLRKLKPQRWQGAKTCNLGVWRDDFVAVNGFNEAYTGWGYEDSDLVIRLLHQGVKHKSGRYATGVYHLWHKENDRTNTQANFDRLQALLNEPSYIRAEVGVSEYL